MLPAALHHNKEKPITYSEFLHYFLVTFETVENSNTKIILNLILKFIIILFYYMLYSIKEIKYF